MRDEGQVLTRLVVNAYLLCLLDSISIRSSECVSREQMKRRVELGLLRGCSAVVERVKGSEGALVREYYMPVSVNCNVVYIPKYYISLNLYCLIYKAI